MTRILGRDQIGFSQRLQGSQCDILQIPNWCRDNREQRRLPALGNLCRQLDGCVLCSYGNCLALGRLKIVAAKKRRLAADFPFLENAPRHAFRNLVGDIKEMSKFGGGQDVILYGADRATLDPGESAIQDGIGGVVGDDGVSAILLQGLDKRVGQEDLDARFVGPVLKGGDGQSANRSHRCRPDFSKLVTAPAEKCAGNHCCDESDH